MEAGRELDALVAERVMEWKRVTARTDSLGSDGNWIIGDETVAEPPHYSTDIAAAWEVVAKVSRPDVRYTFEMSQDSASQWCAGWYNNNFVPELRDATCLGATAPHAICLAALKAVGAL